MQADALSHFSKDHVSDREDNCQVQVLGPKHFLAAAHSHFRPEINSLGDRIRLASQREAEVIESLKSIDKTTPRALLCHGRDVHPTWASVDNVTATLRVWDSKSSKSDEDLASF